MGRLLVVVTATPFMVVSRKVYLDNYVFDVTLDVFNRFTAGAEKAFEDFLVNFKGRRIKLQAYNDLLVSDEERERGKVVPDFSNVVTDRGIVHLW